MNLNEPTQKVGFLGVIFFFGGGGYKTVNRRSTNLHQKHITCMYGKRICLKIKEKKFDGDNVDLKKG